MSNIFFQNMTSESLTKVPDDLDLSEFMIPVQDNQEQLNNIEANIKSGAKKSVFWDFYPCTKNWFVQEFNLRGLIF